METTHSIPNKFTPTVVLAIRHGLLLGNTRRAVAEAAGISRTAFYDWLKNPDLRTFGYDLVAEKGPDGKIITKQVPAPVVTFRQLVIQSEAAGEHRLVNIIAQAASGGAIKSRRTHTSRTGTVTEEVTYALPDPAAAQWLLERKNPLDWAQKKREADFSQLSDEDLLGMLATNMIDQELLGMNADPATFLTGVDADIKQVLNGSQDDLAESGSDTQRQLTGPEEIIISLNGTDLDLG